MNFDFYYKSKTTKHLLTLCLPLALIACSNNKDSATTVAPEAETPAVAVMSDVHFENVYGDLKSTKFSGIPTGDGKFATIRTMYAQLTSTRLFNENYFAFRGALDDAYSKGIRLVALSGDYSDDAQPINIDGIAAIMKEYQAKGMRFFIAPGNHDPNEPYDDDEAGKNDFLTAEGKEQKVYATGYSACKNQDANVTCTNQLMELGYEKLIAQLGEFGYMPNKADVHWETPFSTYTTSNYSYDAAVVSAEAKNRQFEICAEGEGGNYKAEGEKKLGKPYTKCTSIIDSSYLVEPVKGIWLLSIDANVHIPNAAFDPFNPKIFKGFDGAGNAGWNKVLTHKKHLLDWIKTVNARAKAQGKRLIAFSHYPTMDFYANQTDAMKAVFKSGAFQVARVPELATTTALAATGLQLHLGGHMHFNGTNDYKDASGNYLVNVQSPSLAVFGASYKIVKYKDQDTVDIETISLNNVARYNELFKFYQTEYDYLQNSTAAADISKRWSKDILNTKSYGEFTRYYFGELSRLRFMDEYWPCEMKEAASMLDAKQMLILSQLQTQVSFAQLKDVPGVLPLTANCMSKGSATGTPVPATQLSADWVTATAKATQLATAAGFKLDDFAKISAYEFYGDFHRTVYAGELALRDMGTDRVKQYKVLMNAFPSAPSSISLLDGKASDQNPVHVLFQNQFKQVFAIFKGLGSGKPSDKFTINFKTQTLTNTNSAAASFN